MISNYFKIFNCQVHNSIFVSPMAAKIIDTREFQRLRHIKQLGLCHFVYPAATHSRFEHSLGVYHLTAKMLEKIVQQYPNRKYHVPDFGDEPISLTDKMIECIKIAGLCHDIGHGPFSHIFDDELLKNSVHPNRKHETRSCLITEIICKRELSSDLDDVHIKFISSIINPSNHGAIYQIVSNQLNGVDVDKFDYLVRDSKNLGLSISFNFNRLITDFIVDENENIAYPKICSLDIYEMFHSRYIMHKKVYSHKTVKLLELMLCDIFIKIDPFLEISKSIDDMEKFCKLTDESIFNYIQTMIKPPPFLEIKLDSTQYQHIIEANEIYQNIITRNLYQQVFKIITSGDAGTFKDYSVTGVLEQLLSDHPEFNKDDFIISKVKIGLLTGNIPEAFSKIFFYHKKRDNTFTIGPPHISSFLTHYTEDISWQIICKKKSDYDIIMNEMKKYEYLINFV